MFTLIKRKPIKIDNKNATRLICPTPPFKLNEKKMKISGFISEALGRNLPIPVIAFFLLRSIAFKIKNFVLHNVVQLQSKQLSREIKSLTINS